MENQETNSSTPETDDFAENVRKIVENHAAALIEKIATEYHKTQALMKEG